MGSTYSQLHFHIIFGVKERRSLINATMRERLHQYIGGIVRKEGGVLQAIGGSSDHIHILVALPPTYERSRHRSRCKIQFIEMDS